MRQYFTCPLCQKKTVVQGYIYSSKFVGKTITNILLASSRQTDRVCLSCQEQICEFCLLKESEDSCVCCGASFCQICMNTWEKLDKDNYMYGDHAICRKCVKKIYTSPELV